MSLGKHLGIAFLAGLALATAGCGGGGGSSGSMNSMQTAVQDLTLDPEGMTTVLGFASGEGLAGATTANFTADGGQAPLSIAVAGEEVTVSWDARVTPEDQVSAIGLAGVSPAVHAVTTTNPSAPTFTIADAEQNSGVGNDTLTIDFSGVHVVEATVENPSNWTLSVGGTALDLTGSVFTFDASDQTVAVDLGPLAHLHASFTLAAQGVLSVADVPAAATAVAGNATGDTSAPTLVSADQNLTQDEYGRVVDFTFSEAMSPEFATSLANFSVALPDVATSVSQPLPEVLRVAFNNPMLPGVNQVTLTNLVDLHGNDFPETVQSISQPAPVANAYDGNVQGVTVANALNDYLRIVTIQAFDPDSAIDPTKWTLTVAANPVTMADQTFDYDMLAKTLTITLDFDMQNGETFTIVGNGVLDVDGQPFSAAQFDTIAGETTAPTVTAVVQNRNFDPRGRTLDVQMSEDVDQASSESLSAWSTNGAHVLLSATRLPSLDQVRLVFDTLVVPGAATLSVADVADLAGNPMAAPQTALPITSTDVTPPTLTTATLEAPAGPVNDTIVATFSEDMIEGDVQNVLNWHVESPVGHSVPTGGTLVSYDIANRRGHLIFTNGINFLRGDDFRVSFTNARDWGGNVITAAPVIGLVDAETTLPLVDTVYREASVLDELVVLFSEPCGRVTDLYGPTNLDGMRYELYDSLGVSRGSALAANALGGGLGVRLSFGVVIDPTDTLDVYGIVDLVGNPLFPELGLATVAEDTTEPSLALGFSAFTSVSGEGNDVITVEFDRPMSPWNLLTPSNYVLAGGGPVTTAGAHFTFDGTDTVTIDLALGTGHDLQTGGAYDLSINGVWSAQGAQRTIADTETGILAGGDVSAPVVAVNRVRLDPANPLGTSLLIEVDEALDEFIAENSSNYNYDGANLALSAELLGPRVIRTTFAVAPTVGNTLELTVADLAGNSTGPITRAVDLADTAAPLISAVAGLIHPGWGGDRVTIAFDEPVTALSALDLGHYVVQNGTATLDLSQATIAYASGTNTVTIRLPGGVELNATQGIGVTIQLVADMSGNLMPSPVVTNGLVSGDTAPPAFDIAFVNYAQAVDSTVIDVLFTEDVPTAFVTNPANWTVTGPSNPVTAVTAPERNHARLTLTVPLGPTAELSLTNLTDLAQNVAAGPIQVDPLE